MQRSHSILSLLIASSVFSAVAGAQGAQPFPQSTCSLSGVLFL